MKKNKNIVEYILFYIDKIIYVRGILKRTCNYP